jgi:3-deoxy-D-manno-octulosonic-acid transferase
MHLLYSLLLAAALLLLLPYFLFKGLREKKYLHNFFERLGRLPDEIRASSDRRPAIWIHAVSVGETLAAAPLAAELRQRFPQHRLVISTTTDTGQRLARQRIPFADAVFYFPLDFAFAVRRVLRAVQPALIAVLETEIWPNFLREARRAAVPVVFVNGRISERSFRQYQWVSHFDADFVPRVLADAHSFLMQSDEDAARVCELGAPPEHVAVIGNLKYDLTPPESGPLVTWFEEQVERQERWPLVVAGSVLADEEQDVLAGFDLVQRRWRRALLVLAPRKPDRFDAAARIVADDGWNVQRRSQVDSASALREDADVFLLDTVGELAGFYRLADAVFVGGSLVPGGGHNILEPACFAKPPVFGPHMDNFRDMAKLFLEEMAAVQVWSGAELGQRWIELIDDNDRRERMGRAARALVERNRGATARAVARLAQLLQP